MSAVPLSNLAVPLALAISITFAQPLVADGQAPAAGAAHSLADLAWLAGDWQTAPGGRTQVEEHWTQPAAGTLIGMGRTIAGGRTVEFEFLRLEQRGADIYYVAHPKARSPGTEFKLTQLTAQDALFENPAHDFPKRISYRKNADGSLTASIDAGEGTRTVKFSYLPMKK